MLKQNDGLVRAPTYGARPLCVLRLCKPTPKVVLGNCRLNMNNICENVVKNASKTTQNAQMKVHKYRLFTELGQGVLEITESTASIRNVLYILSVLPGGALSPAGLDLVAL